MLDTRPRSEKESGSLERWRYRENSEEAAARESAMIKTAGDELKRSESDSTAPREVIEVVKLDES